MITVIKIICVFAEKIIIDLCVAFCINLWYNGLFNLDFTIHREDIMTRKNEKLKAIVTKMHQSKGTKGSDISDHLKCMYTVFSELGKELPTEEQFENLQEIFCALGNRFPTEKHLENLKKFFSDLGSTSSTGNKITIQDLKDAFKALDKFPTEQTVLGWIKDLDKSSTKSSDTAVSKTQETSSAPDGHVTDPSELTLASAIDIVTNRGVEPDNKEYHLTINNNESATLRYIVTYHLSNGDASLRNVTPDSPSEVTIAADSSSTTTTSDTVEG